jgi:hypothetical protein
MAYVWQRWLARELRAAGLKVVEVQGWENRGRPASTGSFNPRGPITNHHTGTKTSASRPMPTLQTLIRGRSDLPGPLAQVGVGYDGTVYVIAAGRANHAGRVGKSGVAGMPNGADGNALAIGDEIDTNGTQVMPKVQRDSVATVNAVVIRHYDRGTSYVHRHQDISGTGKWDLGSRSTSQLRSDAAAEVKRLTSPPKPEPKPVTSHTRWAVRVTGVHATKGGKKLRDLKAGESFKVIDGSGHGNDGWVQTTHGNWVLGKDTSVTDPDAPKIVDFMTWNVENKGEADAALDRAEIVKLLDEKKPRYAAFQEVYRVDLRGIPGYRTYQAFDGYSADSENRAQAILVRNDVALKIKQALAMTEEWTGPKMGVKKAPRIHRYVVGNEYDTNIPFATVHVPFTKAAVEETREAIVNWLLEMEAAHGIAFAVGDWNGLADELQAKVGDPAGAKVDGGGLDKVAFIGAKKVKGENLDKRGRSDHPVKIWTFEI